MRAAVKMGIRLMCCLALVSFWQAGAAEVTSGTVAAGTRYATPWYRQKSSLPGPTVVITGGVHGNEPAGAAAAEQIRHWPIRRGTLIVIPRANAPGLAAKTRDMPGEPAELANLNRNFPRTGKTEPPRGVAATALWTQIVAFKPDWVIDLHEGIGERTVTTSSVGSSVIAARSPECLRASALMTAAVNATITDPNKKFVQLRNAVGGSLSRAASEHLKANTLILETTFKGQPLALRTRQHQVMMQALLKHLEMIDAAVKVDNGIGKAKRKASVK